MKDRDTKHLILATIPSLLVLLDDQARVTEWNRAAEDLFAIPATRIMNQPLGQAEIEWDVDRLIAGIDTTLNSRQPYHLNEFPYLRPDGSPGILGLTLIPVLGEQQESLGCILQGADTTDRKMLESQLTQAQKMESIGQLAAGIAHEINTPIQYVGDNIRFLQDAFADLGQLLQAYDQLVQQARDQQLTPERLAEFEALPEQLDLEYLRQEIPQAVNQSLSGVDQVATIVRAMKQFSHPGSTEKTATDLNAAIESTATVARNEWKYVAELALELDPQLPLVPCLRGDLNQSLLNIIVNAAHAIADKLGESPAQKGTITIRSRQRDRWAEIRISDTGSGIPEKIRGRIFDPFFTTKEVGKGTGQGLALAYSLIVDKHDGRVSFETQEDEGTTFIIQLPIANKEVQA